MKEVHNHTMLRKALDTAQVAKTAHFFLNNLGGRSIYIYIYIYNIYIILYISLTWPQKPDEKLALGKKSLMLPMHLGRRTLAIAPAMDTVYT